MGRMRVKISFVKNKKGVSAVIGTILMVAITVAIVGILWGYLSGFFSNLGGVSMGPVATLQQEGNHVAIESVEGGTLPYNSTKAIFVNPDGSSAGEGTINDLDDNWEVNGGDTISEPSGLTAGTYTVKLIYNGKSVGSATYVKS